MTAKPLSIMLAASLLGAGIVHAEIVQYNFKPDGKQAIIRGFNAAHLSENGRFVTFDAGMDHSNPQIIRWDRKTGERIVVLNEYSNISISNDASLLALHTNTRYLENDDTNLWYPTDVYVKNIDTGSFELITQSLDSPIQASTIAPGGAIVAYAANEPKLTLFNRKTKEQKEVSLSGHPSKILLSADGKYVVANLHSLQNGINSNRLVLIDIEAAQEKTLYDGFIFNSSLSSDGRFVSFLAGGNTHIYDRKSGQFSLLTKKNGDPITIKSNNLVNNIDISGDGRYIAFISEESDIVDNDYNGIYDAFVLDRNTYEFSRISIKDDGQDFSGKVSNVSVSDDGHYISFMVYTDNYNGYVATNPLYAPEYCKSYSEFTTE